MRTSKLTKLCVLSCMLLALGPLAPTSSNSRGVGLALANAEEAAVNTLSDSFEEQLQKNAEAFEFQAEVNRLMDIIINSLYKNKEIFLRELISNASDALDKIRFLSVSAPDALGDNKELRIRIKADKEAGTLTITDSGIGMTRAELIANLGTVAKSGTTNFVEAMSDSGDLSLIGQFGVGFYSIYLVADKVQVISKHNDDDQYVWESTADSKFTVSKDPRGNTLGRGTEIVLHLKEDAGEFLETNTLKNLISRYSEFISFPIYTWTEKDTMVPVDEEEGEEEVVDLDEAGKETEGEEDEEEEEEEEENAPEMKSVKMWDWERVNNQQAVWARDKSEVTDEQYQAFYKSVSKDYGDALSWIHFKAEGEVEFKSILYIPSRAPYDMGDKYYEKYAGLKLYVRKVLITDEFEDLLPRYLNFIKGVVDSDDLPLNVSRETLQQHKVLKVMGKKLVRKCLEMLRKLATDDEKDGDGEEDDEVAADGGEKGEKYLQFWKEFGKNIKMGVIEDATNRTKLIKLLRYKSNKSDGKFISLDDYVARMPEWQSSIYYITGESEAAVEDSPFLEKLKAKGLEVLYMTEPIDEYAAHHMTEYEDKKLMSVTKEGLKFGDEDETLVKRREKFYKKTFKPLSDFLKKLYGPKIGKIVVSQRVEGSPSVIVTAQHSYSANMERIMKAQAFSNQQGMEYMFSQKTMEINPRHPIVVKLNKMVEAAGDGIDDMDEKTAAPMKDTAWLLYDTALAASGFPIDVNAGFSDRMFRTIGTNLGLESMAILDELELPEEEEEEGEDDFGGSSAGLKESDMPPDLDFDKMEL